MALRQTESRLSWLMGLLYCTLSLYFLQPSLRAAPPKSDSDSARWLPSRTAFYFEVKDARTLAKELANLLTGTPLDNYPFNLRQGPTFVPGWLSELAVWLAPDMLPETQKLGGAAFAIVDTNNKGEMQWVAMLHLGDTNAPTLSLRRAMTEGQWRVVDEVAGVKLFYNPRVSVPGMVYVEDANQKPAYGCVVAVVSGAILTGTPQAVAEVIHRSNGNAVGPNLADQNAFQEARTAQTKKGGQFFYVHWNRLLDINHPFVQMLQKGVDAKAVQQIVGQVNLQQGMLSMHSEWSVNELSRSPLLNVIPPAPLKPSLLQWMPKETVGFIALAQNQAASRWEALLEWMDTLAKLSGAEMRLPSRSIDRLEDITQIKFAKDLSPNLKQMALAFVANNPQSIRPLLILEANQPNLAQKWQMEWFAQIVSAWVGQPVQLAPVEANRFPMQQVQLDRGITWYIARQEQYLLISNDLMTINAALSASSIKQGLDTDKTLASAFSETEGNGMVVGFRPHPSLMSLHMSGMNKLFEQSSAHLNQAPTNEPPPPGAPMAIGQGGAPKAAPPGGSTTTPGAAPPKQNPGAGMSVPILTEEMRRRAQQGLNPLTKDNDLPGGGVPPAGAPPGGAPPLGPVPPPPAAGPSGSDSAMPKEPMKEIEEWIVIGGARRDQQLVIHLYPFPIKLMNRRLVDVFLNQSVAMFFGHPTATFPGSPYMGGNAAMPPGPPGGPGQPLAQPPMQGPIFATPIRVGEDPPPLPPKQNPPKPGGNNGPPKDPPQ